MKKLLNLKNRIICIAVMVVFFVMAMMLNSCGLEKLISIEVISDSDVVYIGNFKYDDYKVLLTYDNGRTEEIALTADMISDTEKLKLYVEGNHDIKVVYQEKETSFNIDVERNVFSGVIFNDVETVYTGQDVVMEVKNVPEGTVVSYPGSNKFRNAGTYDVKAILRKDSYEAMEITARLTIKKADYDLSGISFEDKTFSYNGSRYNLKVEGSLPKGLAVDYTIAKEGGKEESGNYAQNAGTYTVKATFSGDFNNYNIIYPKLATLTISKAEVDMSGVSFNGEVFTYDRQVHSLAIEGNLPVGVSVSYENNGQTNVGDYEVIAKFTHRDSVNYAAINDMKADLIIDKANYDLSNIHFDSISTDYDGKEKRVVLSGVLPASLDYEIENNGKTDSGSYEVTIKFKNHDENYNTPEDIKAYIVINPVVANLDDIVFDKTRFVGYYVGTYDEDVYIEANAFRPTNIPEGLEIDKLVYYKLDVDEMYSGSLDVFDGVTGDFVERITEDGYYIVVANFKESINYQGVHPIKTQIKVTTAKERYVFLSGYYDPDWRWTSDLSKTYLENAKLYLESDDCSALTEMLIKEKLDEYASFDHDKAVIKDPLLNRFDRLAQVFNKVGNTYTIDNNLHEYVFAGNNEFMTSLFDSANELYSNALDEITSRMTMTKLKTGVFGLNKPYDILSGKYYIYVKEPKKANIDQYKELIDGVYVQTEDEEINPEKIYYQEATYNDYLLMIARLFGYEIYDSDKNDITLEKFLANVNNLKEEYLDKKNIEDRLNCNGAIYTTDGSFILPYLFAVNNQTDGKGYDYVFGGCLVIDANGIVSIWIENVEKALEATNIGVVPTEKIITTYSRCALFEEGESGVYCEEYHKAVIVTVDGKLEIMKHADNVLGVDIDNAEYASTVNGKMCLKILTEDDFDNPEKIKEIIDNSDDIWSYEEFLNGIVIDGNKLARYNDLCRTYLEYYHGAIGLDNIIIDEETGEWLDFDVLFPDVVKPIVAVQGIKNIANVIGEYIVYVDLIDTEGFKMDGSYYTALVIWNV